MSQRPLVIIHGWSSDAEAMKPLAKQVSQASKRPVQRLNLVNYISLDDSITMDDLVDALERAWLTHPLPTKMASVDVIAHSTAGLIIRAWLTRYYPQGHSPIKHLVMLAPANFGSPLAQKGNALIGRILIGLHGHRLFQTGTHILKALEIASPYSWQLALKDRFGSTNFYHQAGILCSVLIGNRGLTGLAAAVNEVGTDGVVRLSTANMNCAMSQLDFTQATPKMVLRLSKGKTAFGIMDGENHETITGQGDGFVNPDTLNTIVNALNITPSQFNQWCQTLQSNNQRLAKRGGTTLNNIHYQNTVCHLLDQYGNNVNDYFLAFMQTKCTNQHFAEAFHTSIINRVHAYSNNSCYRSLLINCDDIKALFNDQCQAMDFNLTAVPQINDTKLVGYHSVTSPAFDKKAVTRLFKPNRTLLMSLKIKREQTSEVLQIEHY